MVKPRPRLAGVLAGPVPGLSSLGLRTRPDAYCLPHSQPHPEEGHPPPLEAAPVSWKSVGPCKSRRESPGDLAEPCAGEETQGEEGPAAAQLAVSRLRSSSMEIREKGSEFLKEELRKAQKVGPGAGPGSWALTQCPEISCTYRGLRGAGQKSKQRTDRV